MPFGIKVASKLKRKSLAEQVAALYGHIEVLRWSDPKLDWESQEDWNDFAGDMNRVRSKRGEQVGIMESERVFRGRDVVEVMHDVSLAPDLDHEFLQQILAAYFFQECLYVVKELGPDCHSVTYIMEEIQSGFDEKVVSYIGHSVCTAVQHLHSKMIMHRDVKGPNVLIDSAGSVKLGGLETCVKLKNIGDLVEGPEGTPHWMAPEADFAVVYKAPYNYKVDIWSIGATILEMAEGHPPHHEQYAMKLVGKMHKMDPPKLVNPKRFHPRLSELLELCLQRNPGMRPDASQLAQHSFFSEVRGSSSDVSSLAKDFATGLLTRPEENQEFSPLGEVFISNLEPQVKEESFKKYEREADTSQPEKMKADMGVYKYRTAHSTIKKPTPNFISLSDVVRSTFYPSEESSSDSPRSELPESFGRPCEVESKSHYNESVKNMGVTSASYRATNAVELHNHITTVPQRTLERATPSAPGLEDLSKYGTQSNLELSSTPNRNGDSKFYRSITSEKKLSSSEKPNIIPYQPYTQSTQANTGTQKSSSHRISSSAISETKTNYRPYSSSSYSSSSHSYSRVQYSNSGYSSSFSQPYVPYSSSSQQLPSAEKPLAYTPYKSSTGEPSSSPETTNHNDRKTANVASATLYTAMSQEAYQDQETLNKINNPLTPTEESRKTEPQAEERSSSSTAEKIISPTNITADVKPTSNIANSGARNKFNRRKQIGN